MKVGILTFHASFNYGSMLQAWAMQTWLKSRGHDVSVINYRPPVQRVVYADPLHISSPRRLAALVYNTCRYGMSYVRRSRRRQRFEEFKNSCMALTAPADAGKLGEYADSFDAIICGSDQIWNTCAIDFSLNYFAPFASQRTRKIAYAPSFGPDPSRIDRQLIGDHMRDFDAVAVRETLTARFIRESGLYGGDVSVVIDPTLLFDAAVYRRLERNALDVLPEGEYMYYYTPSNKSEYIDVARAEARRRGLRLVCDTGYMPVRHRYSDVIYVDTAGPLEFLRYVDNARCVIASSFHAIAFSVIFHKEFIAINGDTDSRKSNLLEALGLLDRSYSMRDHAVRPSDNAVDWIEVDRRLDRLRDLSGQYLDRSLQS